MAAISAGQSKSGSPTCPAEAARVLEVVGEAAGIDEELLGHAAADDAGAAEPVLLGDGDLGAVARRNARRAHAARAGADHEQVEVGLGHCCPAASSEPHASPFSEPDEADAVGAGDDGKVGDAEEHAVLDHAGDQLQGLVEILGVAR